MANELPRWLDLDSAAAYVSLRPDVFSRKVRAGLIPAPSTHLGKRTLRWDRGALDATMGGGTGSTDVRETVNALANEIAGQSARTHSAAHAGGRNGQGIPLRPGSSPKARGTSGG